MNAMFNNNQWNHLKLKGKSSTKEVSWYILLKNFFDAFPVNLLGQSKKNTWKTRQNILTMTNRGCKQRVPKNQWEDDKTI